MKNHLRSLPAFLLALVLLLPVFAAEPPALPPLSKPPADGVRVISETELRKHLTFLASEELGGRFTFSPGKDIAARYLASRLESYGYRGAAPDGSFLQRFDLNVETLDAGAARFALTRDGERTEPALGEYFPSAAGQAAGELVWAGYGISAPRLGHDDYAGLDVVGKIVLLASGTPQDLDASAIREEERSARAAAKHGAAGAIFLPGGQILRFLSAEGALQRALARERITLAAAEQPGLPTITLNRALADALLAPLELTLDSLNEKSAAGEPLPAARPLSASAQFTVAMQRKTQGTQNVVGILEGTDPKLKQEYVAFAAHYDHLRTGSDGRVFPGADDDGSGTVGVLNIARALAAHPPRRSVLIVFHAAEELGLLGARYNTDHAPVVPLDRIALLLNVDMIGRSRAEGDENPRNKGLTGADSVYLIGSDRVSRELHHISERANADSERFTLDYTYNDPNHPERMYFRSDHWHYAKHGVPILFYFTGVHEDYHRPTDTVDKIDWKKLQRITRLIYETGWRVANLDRRVKLDSTPPAAAGDRE
jgi:hypothetical protein